MINQLYEVLENSGVNSFYLSSVLVLLITVLAFRKDLTRWSALPGHRKNLIVSCIVLSTVMIALSILDFLKRHQIL
jgi:hypothetical protein